MKYNKEKKHEYYIKNRTEIIEKVKNYTLLHLKEKAKRNKKWKEKNKEKVKISNNKYQQEYRKSPRSKYTAYKAGAKRRKIDFLLSFEEFVLFWNKPCFYCGDFIPTIGLDRIDSNLGYKKDNIKSCCWLCNKIKRRLPIDIFLNQCIKIGVKQKDLLE